MKKIPILITGVGGGGHGEQILKALRLAKTEYQIIGGDMNPFSKGLAEVDVPYILPPATSDDYLDAVMRVCVRHKVRALFHGSEPELKVLSKHRKTFEDNGIFLPINSPEVIEMCMDKFKTISWLKANGFKYPRTDIINSRSDLGGIDYFPIVLKPFVGGGGSSNVFIAQDKNELDFLATYLLKNIGSFISQEYLGTVNDEFTVGVLFDMNGFFLNSIAVKRTILSGLSNRIRVKNRTGNSKFGDILAISSGISQGEVGHFPDVCCQCEKIAITMKSKGTINIQCRFVEGDIYVFEINPRFSGTTSLRAMVGYNEPDILIRKHLLREDIKERFAYEDRTIVRGLSEIKIEERFQYA